MAKKVRLFLVEDDPRQAAMMSRFLMADGFTVQSVTGPIGATNAARAFCPDVLLVDLDLPGFDGDRLIPILRQHGIEARFFVYSARDERAIESAAKGVGAQWFSKSLPLDEVSRLLRG